MPIWSIENNVDYLDVSKLKKANNYEIEEEYKRIKIKSTYINQDIIYENIVWNNSL